jgi:hypothetical protein
LSCLLADDHPQYLLVNGARAMAGNLNMGSNNVVSAGTYNGVTVQAHASRHLPISGADPLPTSVPVDIGTANSIGILNTFSRGDHVHNHGDQPGGSLHALATTIAAGFMSAADKTKIDNVIVNGGNTFGAPITIGTNDNFAFNFETNGTDRIQISNTGAITIPGLATAGVVQTNVSGLLSSSNGTNGQVLIGGGAAPAWANITSTGGTISITNGANSLNLETSSATANSFPTNSGTATPAAGILNILGSNNISTSGAGNTVTINVSGTTNRALQVGNASGSLTSLPVATNGQIPIGSTGANPVIALPTNGSNISWVGGAGTLTANLSGTTNNAVQIGNVGGSLTSLAVGTNGQVLLGATGAAPAFANLTSTGGTISFTTGANSLNLETSSATANSFTTNSGTATPAAGVLNILGGNNISTSGAGNTVTVNVSGTTNRALQVGNASGSLTSLAVATNGQIPIGSTGANPVIANITSSGGTITITNGPGSINLDLSGTGPFVLKSGDTMTGALQLPTGTAAAPSLRFTGSTTTGLSAAVADTLVLSTAGSGRISINSVGATTISAPTAGNALAITGNAGSPTVSITSNAAQNSIIASLGAVGNPAYSFIGDTNTGMFSPAADQLNLATGGTNRLLIDSTGSVTSTSNYKAGVRVGTTYVNGAGPTTVQFDTEMYDPNSNFNTATFLYTAPVTGYYSVMINLSATYSNDNTRSLQLIKNGVAQTGFSTQTDRRTAVGLSAIIPLTAGDTLGAQLTSGGGTVNVQANHTSMFIHFLSI